MKTLSFILALLVVAASQLFAQTEYQLKPAIGALPKTNIIVFSALIDATDNLIIRNGKVQIQHVAGKPPTNMSINGKEWNPRWKKDITDSFSKFSPSLPVLKDSKVTVELLKGRGSATVLESPTIQNDYSLIIQIRDGGSGAREAEVRVTIVPAP
jgi:hypothetical protein